MSFKSAILFVFILQLALTSSAQDIEESIKKEKPVTYKGSLELRGIGYGATGIAARRSPFTYILNGNAEVDIYGVAIPFSITLSEQERNVRQPFNQFGMSPKYKWVQLHLGYRNIIFSPYTLAGYTMLGAGIELTPGKLRFGFMYGRLNRATAIDTTTGLVQPYSFSRKGYAIKLGYGTDKRNIELSYLKAQDDSNSVRKDIPDSMRNVNPAGNAVFALHSIYTFAKKLFVEIDGGGSIYTNNIGSKLGQGEDLEKINSYTKGIVIVNATTLVNFAYSGSIGYKEKNWSVKASYKHIDPEFQSMGAYFFQNDIESYTLGGSFNAFKSRLRFAGSFGFQNDNLRKQKTAQTTRMIGNASLSYDINEKLGFEASYINFSSSAAPKVVSVNNKYMLAQTTHNASLTPRYILVKPHYTHVIVASYNYSVLNDHNAETSLFNNINTNVIFLTYSITHNLSGLTITAGGNKTGTKFYTGIVNSYGGTLGANKGFFKTKLQAGVTFSYSRTDQFGAASIINGGLTADYSVTKHHKFSLRYNMLNNKPDNTTATSPAYTEHTAEVAYILSF